MAVTYLPQISGDGGATWTTLTATPALSATFSGLVAAHPYSMRVKAVSSAGVPGANSAVVATSTLSGVGVIGDATGTQAIRATQFVSTFGTNIYPLNGQDGGATSELAGQFTYLMGGTGHRLLARPYVWGGRGVDFAAALQALITSNQILAAPTVDHFFSNDPSGVILCCQILNPADIAYAEGLNEPNTAGFGNVIAQDILTTQQALRNQIPAGIKIAGASVLYSCNDQVNFWNAAGLLPQYLAACDYITSHLYPNGGCFSANNQLIDWTNTAALGGKPMVMTEIGSGLYNNAYDQTNYELVSGWHTLCGWMNAYAFRGCQAFVWWTMNDYAGAGFAIPVGLFANAASNPHRYTTQFAAFIKLLTDLGGTSRTFTTGKLNVVTSGLPAGSWQYSGGQQPFVLQTSNGHFWLPLYNEQQQFSGTTTNVTLTFGTAKSLIEVFPITNNNGSQASKTPAARQSGSGTSITIPLGTEVLLVHVVM